MTRTLTILAAVAALAVSADAASASTSKTLPTRGTASVPAATTQGIIMKDGGICDPIRHMGC
jgi:hypothetical protein